MNISSLELAQTWLDWAREHAIDATYDIDPSDWLKDKDVEIMGYLIQASAEQPAEFARVFAPILGSDQTNPLTNIGEGTLLNLVRNGVCDDWEIYLQWREEGYVVVNESDREPQDARFGFSQAKRLLDTLTGGPSMAPGTADVEALLQNMYETDKPPTPGRRP